MTSPFSQLPKLTEEDRLRSENIHLRLVACAMRQRMLLHDLQTVQTENEKARKDLELLLAKFRTEYNISDEELAAAFASMTVSL